MILLRYYSLIAERSITHEKAQSIPSYAEPLSLSIWMLPGQMY